MTTSDVRERPYSATVDGAGAAVIRVKATTRALELQQISTDHQAAVIGSTCGVYKNGFRLFPMIPSGGVASGVPYPKVGQSDAFEIRWAGCTPGTTVFAVVFYREL